MRTEGKHRGPRDPRPTGRKPRTTVPERITTEAGLALLGAWHDEADEGAIKRYIRRVEAEARDKALADYHALWDTTLAAEARAAALRDAAERVRALPMYAAPAGSPAAADYWRFSVSSAAVLAILREPSDD